MKLLMQRALFTAAQVRAQDRHAIEELGVPGFTLMTRAAHAALGVLRTRWPQARSLLLLCGPGNNGGDAFLLGALALQAGLRAHALALSATSEGDALRARQAYEEAGGACGSADDAPDLSAFDVIVDGLFGTGLSRAPEGAAARLIEQVNASGRPLLALDLPSGLDADTGVAREPCVRAAATVTFVAHKRGLFTADAGDCCGALHLDRLELPPPGFQSPDAELLHAHGLPPRRRNSHKGANGHVLALGGDAGMGGAIRLCAEAALRAGAGLVSVATRAAHIGGLNAARPELMAHAVEAQADLEPLIRQASVLAIGPGLGQDDWGRALWQSARTRELPCVIDADALNLLAAQRVELPEHAVLTPHPGEAARLLQTDTASIQADRFAAARALAERYGAVVVLKGSGSLIAAPDGHVAVCPWGNPGMAAGGMGDVLTGVIAALLAQGLSPWEAAGLGVGLHARAGDHAAAAHGERGLLASDLFLPLRELLNADPN
ncbi:NAD(P)H-hydrate dehydratase [Oleiagrimonas citrea]|uniref:Bifunctional NAD(P)H-hydrate repair enzyme n=2 Tax=Oleiagrimonas citrea TaxID=1665687 RepID=A0A846ZGJ8_9GAMM|nr:NAD(P)H-hydrate dehydratase [Oleiagrimonas citrea]